MEVAHVVMAVFAAARFMDLIKSDVVFIPFRRLISFMLRPAQKRWWPEFDMWQCSMCVTVWASIIATLALVFFPYGNYPFAFSTLVLLYKAYRLVRFAESPVVVLWPARGLNNVNIDYLGGATPALASQLIADAAKVMARFKVAK